MRCSILHILLCTLPGNVRYVEHTGNGICDTNGTVTSMLCVLSSNRLFIKWAIMNDVNAEAEEFEQSHWHRSIWLVDTENGMRWSICGCGKRSFAVRPRNEQWGFSFRTWINTMLIIYDNCNYDNSPSFVEIPRELRGSRTATMWMWMRFDANSVELHSRGQWTVHLSSKKLSATGCLLRYDRSIGRLNSGKVCWWIEWICEWHVICPAPSFIIVSHLEWL